MVATYKGPDTLQVPSLGLVLFNASESCPCANAEFPPCPFVPLVLCPGPTPLRAAASPHRPQGLDSKRSGRNRFQTANWDPN